MAERTEQLAGSSVHSPWVSGTRPWHAHWPPYLPLALDYPHSPAWWLLGRNLERHAERPAIRYVEGGREAAAISYAELYRRALSFAAGLRALGIERGQRVALYLPNSPELVVGYFGAWMAGAVAVPCSAQGTEADLAHHVDDSGASLLACAASNLAVARCVATPRHLPLVIAGAAAPEPGEVGWEQLARPAPAGFQPAEVDPAEDLAVLLYTGGTTGTPKGAMLTHANVVANATQFARWYDFREGDEVCISVLPLFHSGGFSGAMTVPLASGATVLLLRQFSPGTVLDLVGRYRATRLFGVPTMFIALLNHPDVHRCDFSSLRACRTNAAPLPPPVKAAFDELVGREVLIEGYGLTEASPLAHANPLHRAKPGSIGVPLPDTDARVVDPLTGRHLPPGEEGELWIRGPQVMRGYWDKPAATADVLRDGWLRTGDVVRMDEDGYFFIVDRSKDCIITSGYKVWPREVEDALYRHPAVAQAAVVGVPDAMRGEAVKAFVVLKPDAAATLRELVAHCHAYLSPYKCPRAIEFRSALPTSAAGKVLRRALRDEATGAVGGQTTR